MNILVELGILALAILGVNVVFAGIALLRMAYIQRKEKKIY